MKAKLLSGILVSVFMISMAFGQEANIAKPDVRQKYKWAAGIGAGFTSGYGFSVKYHPKKEGIQLNFLPYLDNYGEKQLICVGLTLTHDFWSSPYINTYFYVASSYTYSKNIGSLNLIPFSNSDYDKNKENAVVNSGLGVGFEANTQKRVVINLMIGYAQYDSFKQLFLTGEIALHYKFGMNR